ncbi:MAG: glycosyltransferase family 2 protein [Candidatus Methanoperedens sp.]|nr:glycosyltransferase family 2 protein [Candidatus Methanoperedens sp.]MCZ7370624.1 glycosyltransferase family 2 protein [Candidatus Methanoperedens sp.]
MKNVPKITAILPAFNEEVSIGSMVLRSRQHADRVIVVDDGSTDNTAEVARLAGAEVIRHPKNLGKGWALRTGFGAVNGADIIVTMDAEGRPERIPEMANAIKNECYDIVISSIPRNKSSGNENLFFLNRNKPYNKKEEFLALSAKSLSKIDLTILNGSSIKNILSQAERSQMKIKYLYSGKEPNFSQLKGYNIGVVVPAFNEELLIEDTLRGIPEYVKRIYVIDDCSTDRTPEIVGGASDPRIVFVRHDKNRGVGAAIVSGYKLALEDDMDIVAVMAGDDQMDPEQLPRLLMPIIEERADYTKGNRLISKEFRHGMSKWRFFGNAMLTMITKIATGYWHVMDPQNGYTAISRRTLEILNLDSIYPYYGYCNDLLVKLNTFGMRVEDVVMPARYGRERSKIKYSRYILKVAPMLFRGFLWRLKTKYIVLDFHPLVFFYVASMVLLPAGMLLSLWILVQKLYQNPVSQNLPLLAVFIDLMGLQFLLFAMLFDMQADKSRSGTV